MIRVNVKTTLPADADERIRLALRYGYYLLLVLLGASIVVITTSTSGATRWVMVPALMLFTGMIVWVNQTHQHLT